MALGLPGMPPPTAMARYIWRVSSWPPLRLARRHRAERGDTEGAAVGGIGAELDKLGSLPVLRGEPTAGMLVAFLSGFQHIVAPIRALIGFCCRAAQAAVCHDMVRRRL